MTFNIAAGFAASTTTALSATGVVAARVQAAPQMKQMGTRAGYDCLLNRLSIGICENSAELTRMDLQRLGRRAEAECQLQETLTGLRDKIARKAAVRTRPALVDGSVELYSKAS